MTIRSGEHDNATPVEGVVFSTLVTMPTGTPWLRLFFAKAHLDGGSYLRIVSLHDGGLQTLHARHLAQWRDSSAFFNGATVLLELVAGPNTRGNVVEIDKVMAADLAPASSPPETICGSTDDRVPSSHAAVGRIDPIGCTGWIVDAPATGDDKVHLSAGHCFAPYQVLEFQVPGSNVDCSLVHPPPARQFAIDPDSLSSNAGPGNDYWVFKCFPNSTTNLTTYQTQGAALSLAPALPAVNATLRTYGFGNDGTNANNALGDSCSCTGATGQRNQTQQTHAGPLTGITGTRVDYGIDTCGGDSGAVVVQESTGLAVSIHTHGGCSTAGGSNAGTSVTNANLMAAIGTVAGGLGPPNPEVRWSAVVDSFEHAAAFNPLLQRVVQYGGVGINLEVNSGARSYVPGIGWSPLASGQGPGFLAGAAMATEGAINVLYSGVTHTGAISQRTWTTTGNVWAEWVQAVNPPPRVGFRMAYDSARARVVLYGGWSPAGVPQRDTWEWSTATRWVQRNTSNQGPAVRDHAMAYIPGHGVYLFGGRDANGDSDQTWRLGSTSWSLVSSSGPSARHSHGFASDGQGHIYLYGGAASGSPGPWGTPLTALSDTWRFNPSGTSWQQVSASTPDAFGRFKHSMTWDESRGLFVVHGGRSQGEIPSGSGTEYGGLASTTLEWDPAAPGAGWVIAAPLNAPAARFDAPAAANPVTGEVLTFGGSRAAPAFLPPNQVDVANDFWILQAGVWSPAPTPAMGVVVPARTRHSMCWDRRNGEYLIFGGLMTGGFVTQNTYHGSPTSGWFEYTGSTRPSARQGAAMASTPQGVILHGGRNNTALDDSYLWDGVQWSQLSTATLGAGRGWHAMAYDERRDQVVLFGGATSYSSQLPVASFGETWVRSGGVWQLRNPANSPPPLAFSSMTYDVARERIVLFGGRTNSGGEEGSVAWEWDGTDWTQRRPDIDARPRWGHALVYDHDSRKVAAIFGKASGLIVVEPHYYGTTAPATVVDYGTGCPGTLGPLSIRTVDFRLPWTGSTLPVEIGNLPAASVPFVLIGFARAQIDLTPFGLPGCTQYVSINSSPILHPPVGNVAIFNMDIPADPSFAGLPMCFQGAAINAGGANSVGAAVSAAIEAVVGVR